MKLPILITITSPIALSLWIMCAWAAHDAVNGDPSAVWAAPLIGVSAAMFSYVAAAMTGDWHRHERVRSGEDIHL